MASVDLPFDPPFDPPLDPPLLPPGRPFDRGMAAEVGIGRTALDRMLRRGVVRRVLRGVYVDASVPDSRELRASALLLVVGPGRTAWGATAAWVHGVGQAPARLDVLPAGSRRRLVARDVADLDGLRVTTPLRTALDLGRSLAPDDALGALDAYLHAGVVGHRELLAGLPAMGLLPGCAQLRELVAVADGRAGCLAESVLRRRWYDAALPTPVPRFVVTDVLWLELAIPVRRFGVVLAGRLSAAELAELSHRGWRVVELPRERILAAEPQFLVAHLEREYLQHLLDQVG